MSLAKNVCMICRQTTCAGREEHNLIPYKQGGNQPFIPKQENPNKETIKRIYIMYAEIQDVPEFEEQKTIYAHYIEIIEQKIAEKIKRTKNGNPRKQ